MTLDGFHAGFSGVGDLPEGFPGIHIGDMYLYSGNGDCLQCVQEVWV